MNIEEIKMITEMIVSLGAQGKEAFIIWLVATHGLTLLECIMAVGVFIYTVKKVIHALSCERYCNEIYKLVMDEKVFLSFDESDFNKIKGKLNERKD